MQKNEAATPHFASPITMVTIVIDFYDINQGEIIADAYFCVAEQELTLY